MLIQQKMEREPWLKKAWGKYKSDKEDPMPTEGCEPLR
jgi:hypothetical protein